MMAGALVANAQTTVKGILVDSISREGEPYATVRIYNAQNQKQGAQPVAMALTANDGKFNTVVKTKGNFVAIASSVGKAPATRPFSINGEKEIDLGTLLTTDQESVMKNVEIVAVKPVVKMEADKISYSVEDDVDSKTMTVLDMLRKVPMVMVDGQDNITVNGSSSFKIYVDGKPNMMLNSNPGVILKSMPASMVSNIEVITNPGAKYDAEGASGILNFTLAKMGGQGGADETDFSGYNGSITAFGGNRNVGGSANISGQQKKFSYNANATYTYTDNGTVKVTIDRQQNDGSRTLIETTAGNRVPYVVGNIGMGYDFNAQSSLNGSFAIQRYGVTNSTTPTTTMVTPAMSFGYRSHMSTEMDNTSYNGSLDFQRFFDKERKNSLTMTYQINHTPGHTDNVTDGFVLNINADPYTSALTTDRISNGKETTTEHIGQIDLVNTLSDHSKLNTGLKYALRNSASDMDYYQVANGIKTYMPDMSTDYEHRNQIGAIYAESENSWKKWSVKGGLRYEHTWQNVEYKSSNGSSFSKDYGNLVPSFTTSYSLMPGSSIGLTYNMRISRPGISYLNPYVDRSEPTSLTYGNSDLDVEKSHNIGLVLNLYTPKVIVSSSLRQTIANGGIEQYSFFKDNVLNTTFGNIVDRRISTFNLFMSWSATKNTRITLNGSASYNYLTSDELDTTHDGFSAEGMVNIQQTLPKKWTLGLTAVSNTKSITLQGNTSGMNLGILTVSKSLCKDRLTLSGNFVTGLSKKGELHLDQYAEGKDFTSSTKISVPITRFVLTARWTFGNTSKQFKKHESNVQSDYIEHQSSTESIGNAGSQVN